MSRRRTLVVFDELLAADRALAVHDASWISLGYGRTSARLWRRRDGTVTVRVVWRKRDAALTTITYVMQGLAPA